MRKEIKILIIVFLIACVSITSVIIVKNNNSLNNNLVKIDCNGISYTANSSVDYAVGDVESGFNEDDYITYVTFYSNKEYFNDGTWTEIPEFTGIVAETEVAYKNEYDEILNGNVNILGSKKCYYEVESGVIDEVNAYCAICDPDGQIIVRYPLFRNYTNYDGYTVPETIYDKNNNVLANFDSFDENTYTTYWSLNSGKIVNDEELNYEISSLCPNEYCKSLIDFL